VVVTVEISFGRWLQRRRKALDLTQEALAQRVGCAAETLRKIEADVRRPSRQIAERLAEALEIPETDRAAFVKAARAELAVDRLAHPTQDLPQIAFVSPRSSNKPVTNLPAPLTTFIGREKEQAEVIQLITKHRLVTLTGPGGVGKTRLSIKVGERMLESYHDGVWLVELAPILDPLLMPRVTAIAIGLRDEPQRPVIDMLSDYLREKKMLIILDNCEHLLDACAQLADTLLKRCSELKILATSREILGVLGEAVYHVPSLELADMQQLLEKFRDYESVRLFEARAQLSRVGFSLTIDNAFSVAKICSHLDGIPLAIELAAARVSTFSTEEIEKRLQESFSLLTTGNRAALPRHQTLQAAIDWSYDLLSPNEQSLFQRLPVFINGWTLEAAENVCADTHIQSQMIADLLSRLVNKSLIIMEEMQVGTRYRMLETIRQYANEKLVESGESGVLIDRHLDYFLNYAEIAAPYLFRAEQVEWLPLLDRDYENIRAAIQMALSKEMAEPSLNFCTALGWFWVIRGYWLEAASWLTRALEKRTQTTSQRERIARVRTLNTQAVLQWQLDHIKQMRTSAEESLALALENANTRDIAISKCLLGISLMLRGKEDDRALSLMEQCCAEFQDLDEPFWLARCFLCLGYFRAAGAQQNSRNVILQSIELARKSGERLTLGDFLFEYAQWLLNMGRIEEAREQAEQSEMLYKEIGAENISLNPLLFAEIAWCNGDYQRANSIYMELEQHFRLLGQKSIKSICTGNLGVLAMEEGDSDRARAHLEEALMFEKEAEWNSGAALYLIELGNLQYMQGNLEEFKQKAREGLSFKKYFAEFQKPRILMTLLGSIYFQNPEYSAQLLGIIDYAEREYGSLQGPIAKRYCIRAETHSRKVLGDIAFEFAFVEGQKMSLDEGLDLALKTVEEM
jgi:predicted ATPase/DNA-binding XRE family transcriptional regulator